MRDHGGNLDGAIGRFGGQAAGWIDLSTGINRVPYPLPGLSPAAWTTLPTKAAMERLRIAAARAYGTKTAILPVAGAQAAIQIVPRLDPPGHARVLAPTYNEHAAALRSAGWQVEEVAEPGDLAGADLAVLVNPNNPDGRYLPPLDVLALASRVGRLIVDESFADPYPAMSVASQAGHEGMIVLRSFGKFYGLAGLRLGFVLGADADIAALSDMAGPWPVSGVAIEVGSAALADRQWALETTARLMTETARLDALAEVAGWTFQGGTALFRLYDTGDAQVAQERLALAHIWSRIFPYSTGWIRLGLPGGEAEWARVANALMAGGD
ncbi:threonine-phosphate decarboxylase CobD [Defluviimonas aestuarii]|uniref:threonine-phosphate decarboxylase CobD n=1 Tax=Albidovulum aestuarii TaxID=1130726 RepID=UPI00249B5307|nr:threonine-phosphate decarboxylase CobD [Defluviimonas aestuarii]MDI3337516.1 threonine-phosphate decarboxylase CobD [Defluviimonas aestuarii]